MRAQLQYEQPLPPKETIKTEMDPDALLTAAQVEAVETVLAAAAEAADTEASSVSAHDAGKRLAVEESGIKSTNDHSCPSLLGLRVRGMAPLLYFCSLCDEESACAVVALFAAGEALRSTSAVAKVTAATTSARDETETAAAALSGNGSCGTLPPKPPKPPRHEHGVDLLATISPSRFTALHFAAEFDMPTLAAALLAAAAAASPLNASTCDIGNNGGSLLLSRLLCARTEDLIQPFGPPTPGGKTAVRSLLLLLLLLLLLQLLLPS